MQTHAEWSSPSMIQKVRFLFKYFHYWIAGTLWETAMASIYMQDKVTCQSPATQSRGDGIQTFDCSDRAVKAHAYK